MLIKLLNYLLNINYYEAKRKKELENSLYISRSGKIQLDVDRLFERLEQTELYTTPELEHKVSKGSVRNKTNFTRNYNGGHEKDDNFCNYDSFCGSSGGGSSSSSGGSDD